MEMPFLYMADHPVTQLLSSVRTRLAGEVPGAPATRAEEHADARVETDKPRDSSDTEDPTPKRIHGKKGPGRGKCPAKWVIPLTQREEQMLQRLVDHFDYPRAILGRMLLRDAYRELFSEKPPAMGIEGEGG